MQTFKVASLPGDGIGPEVMPAAVRVHMAVAPRTCDVAEPGMTPLSTVEFTDRVVAELDAVPLSPEPDRILVGSDGGERAHA